MNDNLSIKIFRLVLILFIPIIFICALVGTLSIKNGWENSKKLYEVCMKGYPNRYEIAKKLIRNGADVNIKVGISFNGSAREFTPLHEAVKTRNLKLVKLLVDNGADINAEDYSGVTPFHNAVGLKNNLSTIVYLIKKGANINLKAGWEYETPLHLAVAKRLEKNLIYLIAYGADLNLKNQSGRTPLTMTSYYPDKRIKMKQLIEKALTKEVQDLIKSGNKNKVIGILLKECNRNQ